MELIRQTPSQRQTQTQPLKPKRSNNKLASSEKTVRNMLKEMIIEAPIMKCSAETGRGIDDLYSLFTEFIKPKMEQPLSDLREITI